MSVSAEYVANLVAELNVDKANAQLALAMCPASAPADVCEYCLSEIDWMGYCYC